MFSFKTNKSKFISQNKVSVITRNLLLELFKFCTKHVKMKNIEPHSSLVYQWRIQGGERDTRPRSKFCQFYAVFGKIWQNCMLVPPEGWRPPPRGNPESATVYYDVYSAIHKAAGLTVPGCSMILPGTIPEIPISREWSQRLERPPDQVLYGGRPYGGFVNSAVCQLCQWWRAE